MSEQDADLVRYQHRELSEKERELVTRLKDRSLDLLMAIERAGSHSHAPREMALARTKVEEALMWAIKGVKR